MSLVSSKQKFDKNGQEEENNGIAVQECGREANLQTICEIFSKSNSETVYRRGHEEGPAGHCMAM